ncbi:SWIM zinc finger family protein [Halorarius halobius]|uniref:SWIM zinc finger family protein n=1 Tax=Halorarius halobius TaxID=2962671 RepID=UPI0020CB7FA6|nr:SWIM zinc finger family protein [Halorarius halobius]
MNSAHPLDRLETTDRSLHRAQTEQFAFRLEAGDVIVRNLTYKEPSEHEYRITIEEGVPVDCTCPAEEHYAPACKHRVAVAIRDAVREAAVRMQVAADGGEVADPPAAEREPDDEDVASVTEPSEDCDCTNLPEGVPCWPCFRDGRATFDE